MEEKKKKAPVKRSKKAPAEHKQMPEAIKETPEAVYIYHDGDNIQQIAKIMTGHSYMLYKLLEYNGINAGDIKDGDIIKWRI